MFASSAARGKEWYRPSLSAIPCAVPDVSLAPTVGSRVLLAPNEYDLAFILEDNRNEAEYLLTAARYMIVGKVLRETAKAFLVRFDFPVNCLSSQSCGERQTERSVWHENGNSQVKGSKQHQGEEGEKEDEAQDMEKENVNDKERTEAQKYAKKGIGKSDDTELFGIAELSAKADMFISEHGNNFDLRSPSYTSTLDPLEARVRRTTSDRKYSDEKRPLSENGSGIVRVLAAGSDRFEVASQSVLGAAMRRSSLLCINSAARLGGISASAAGTTGAVDAQEKGYLHVSLTLAKRSCVTLLQYLLSIHDTSGAVTKAMAARNFNEATEAVLHVITAQRGAEERRRTQHCYSDESLSLACNRDVCNVEPRPLANLFASEGGAAHVSPFSNSVNADTKPFDFRPFVSMTRPLSSCDTENSEMRSSRELKASPSTGNPKISAIPREMTRFMSPSSGENSSVTLSIGNSPDLRLLGDMGKARSLSPFRGASEAQVELAPLYALLSFTRFCAGQYEQSLEDASTALSHDATCLEAYVRLVASLLALDSEEDALVVSAVASHRCVALSPQFLRIARVAQISAYFHRSLPQHSGFEVLPCMPQSVAGALRVTNPTTAAEVASFSSIQEVWLPSLHRAPQKAKRPASRPTPLAVRVHQVPQQQQQQTPWQFSPSSGFGFAMPHLLPLLEVLLPSASPPMEFISRSLRARAVREFEMGETIATEEASLFIPLCFLHAGMQEEEAEFGEGEESLENKEADERTFMAAQRALFCAHCGLPLTTNPSSHGRSFFRRSLSLLRRRSRVGIPCKGDCGDWYCGDVCQSRAAVAYHAVECPLSTQSRCISDASAPTGHTSGKNTCGHDPNGNHHNDDSDGEGNASNCSDHCLDKGVGLSLVDQREPKLRAVISGARAAFSEFRAQADSLAAASFYTLPFSSSLSDSLPGVSPSTQMTRAAATALLVAGRIVSSVISLILPITSEPLVGCRDRSAALAAIIQRCTAKGISSVAASTWDRNSLCQAEEILHELRIPFFADPNYVAPITLSELLDETDSGTGSEAQEARLSTANGTAYTVLRDGFAGLYGLLRAVDVLVQEYLFDEPLGVTLTDEVAEEAVRLSDSLHSEGHTAGSPVPEWTCGRLLRFIGGRRFAEQLWDFCLSSHAIVPVDWEFLPVPRRTLLAAAMGPLTCVTADLSRFGGVVCSRFAAEATADECSALPSMPKAKGADSVLSLLSLTSILPNEGEMLSSTIGESLSALVIVGNVNATAGPGRLVTLRARRSIVRGEELRYEVTALTQ